MSSQHFIASTFTHAGEIHEIRASQRGEAMHIEVFKGDQLASPFVYSISDLHAFDLRQAAKFPAVQELIKSAQDDIFYPGGRTIYERRFNPPKTTQFKPPNRR